MLVSKFLKQTATLQHQNNNPEALDEYGEPLAGEFETIRCRRQATSKWVQTPNGGIVQCTNTYYTDSEVVYTDLIDGKKPVFIGEMTWNDGSVQGYKVEV